MKTITHRGLLKETVKLDFENGYSLTLEAGQEMAIFIAVDLPPEKPIDPELRRLAVDVADQVRGSSWNIGAMRKLTDYVDILLHTRNPRD